MVQPFPYAFREPGRKEPCREQMFVINNGVVMHHQWRWMGADVQTGMKTKTTVYGSQEEALSKVAPVVAKLRATGWIEIPDWPNWPGEKADAQPYPHPFRQRVAASYSNCIEQTVSVFGKKVVLTTWLYEGGWTKRNQKKRATEFADAKAARRAADDIVRKITADKWTPLPDWPHLPKDWSAGIVQPPPVRSVAKAPKRPRLKPVALGRLKVTARVKPATKSELAELTRDFGELPADWLSLLARHGGQTFSRYVRILPAAKIKKATKDWLRRGGGKSRHEHWVNFAKAIPDEARLCIVGDTIDGDQIALVGGSPKRAFILPRNYDEVIVLASLGHVLAWYVAKFAEQGDKLPPTYGRG